MVDLFKIWVQNKSQCNACDCDEEQAAPRSSAGRPLGSSARAVCARPAAVHLVREPTKRRAATREMRAYQRHLLADNFAKGEVHCL